MTDSDSKDWHWVRSAAASFSEFLRMLPSDWLVAAVITPSMCKQWSRKLSSFSYFMLFTYLVFYCWPLVTSHWCPGVSWRHWTGITRNGIKCILSNHSVNNAVMFLHEHYYFHHHIICQLYLIHSKYSFNLTNQPKPEVYCHIWLKQQIFTFYHLEPVKVWHFFCWKIDWRLTDHWSCIVDFALKKIC